MHRLATLVLAATLSLGYGGIGLAQAPATPAAGSATSAPPVAGPATSGGARLAAPETPSPQSTRELLRSISPPARDEADLVRRFKLPCGTPAPAVVSLTPEDQGQETRPFWVLDGTRHQFFQVQATLRYQSPHLSFFVQDGAQIAVEALAASAAVFEEKTYPMLRRYFADLPQEPRITVFSGRVPGVSGYFSASDLYPSQVNPYSNERVMVFMNLDATRPGTPGFDAVLAHEAQHLVHWIVKPQQESWINEGASELAMAIAGFEQRGAAQAFLNLPETQLNAWAERPSEAVPHYGGGYLMMEYFAQQMGGYEAIKGLIAAPGTSVRSFDAYLAQQPGTMRFDDLFKDFVLANLLNDRSVADGRYGYERLPLRARVQETHTALPATSTARLRPYGTRYVEFQAGSQRGDLELRFSGAGETPLFAGTPPSGRQQWWGYAADEMESTLTREIDLRGVTQATLRFKSWFDIEQDYDYAGVAVSADGGCHWQSLPGRFTTDTNPVGQNLGHGFTGQSGSGATPTWVEEDMDLSPYAGQVILLRFYYVTDQSYHGPGFAVDDIAIPEIGFADDVETDAGWVAQGFLRTVNATALDWAVQVVAFTGAGPQIVQLPLTAGEGGRDASPAGTTLRGTLTVPRFGEQITRVVVAVSPLVPVTLEPSEYRLEAALRPAG